MTDSNITPEEQVGKKITPTSIISLSRTEKLGLDLANPLNLDQLYATIPEITRSIDFRAGLICTNGYELIPASDEEDAKFFTAICFNIIERSGGVGFIEQMHKNTDLYGDGYVELVPNELDEIVELAHVHPYRFGYETETIEDVENPGQQIDIIKVDKNSQKPVGFATFVVDASSGDLVVDKKIPLEKIAHLKFKTTGDAFYGISLIQPMIGSVTRKVRLEDYADRSARLIAVPKLVLKGNYENEEEKREDAREAANLDVNDVIVLEGEDVSIDFVKPGETNIPALREMFITNITTASGIPRPALTSEGASINKATMDELMKNMRSTIKSHQLLISNLFKQVIFPRIAFSYGYENYEAIVPNIYFLEDNDTALSNIETIQRKSTALTSLANTYALLFNSYKSYSSPEKKEKKNNIDEINDVEEVDEDVDKSNIEKTDLIKKDTGNGTVPNKIKELSKKIDELEKDKKDSENNKDERFLKLGTILTEMEDLLLSTIKTFKFNNDTNPLLVEPYKKETGSKGEKKATNKETKRSVENTVFIPKPKFTNAFEMSVLNTYYTKFTLTEEVNDENKKSKILEFKRAYEAYKNGYTLIDNRTEKIIELNDLINFESKYLQ